MTQSDLFSFTYLFGLALIASVLAILGLAVFLQLERAVGRWVAAAVVPAIALGIASSSLLSGRNLKYAGFNIEAIALSPIEGSGLILRTITAVLVGLCVASIIARLFRRRSPAVLPGQLLLAAFVIFYICNNILNSVLGTYPSFSHNTLYVVLTFVAVFMSRDEPIEVFIRSVKLALLGMMVLSLAAAAALPDLAIQSDYKGWIPGLHFRLWGVGSNPNSIGPLALLLMMLELYCPSSHKAWRLLNYSLGLAVLVLAQSKTAWAAGFAVLPILAWSRYGRAPTGGMRISFALCLISVLVAATLVLMFGNLDKLWLKLAGGQVGSDVSSLSGRVQIWLAALDAWRANPLFGYGPTAWGPLHRLSIGLPFAFSAHNQFLQSLSGAGALGLLSLLTYLGLLSVCAWRASAATRGVSLALLVIVLLRCMTEAPFSAATLFNGDTLTQLVLFRIALLGSRGFSALTATTAFARRSNALA